MIIPVYEAKTLFANIDQVILASIKFVMDLERATAHDIAEVCLKHVSISCGIPGTGLILARKRYLGSIQDVPGQAGRVAAHVPRCGQKIPRVHQLY